MTVLMISHEYPPYLVGGVGTHVEQLACGLVQAGQTVHLVSYSMDRTFSSHDRGVHLHFLEFPLSGRDDQYKAKLHELPYLNQQLSSYASDVIEANQIKPDLIHIHDWIAFGCAESLRHRYDVPIIITAHIVQGWLLENLMPMPAAIASQICRLEQESFNRADKIVAVSSAVKREIIARYGLNERKIEVVFNGLDTSSFASRSPSATLERERERLGCGLDKLIIYAGRFSPQKGVSALIRSAMQVLRQRRDVSYLIAGKRADNPYADLLTMMVLNHPQLKKKVLFLDFVSRERLAVLYQLAAVAVVPSIFEPFGYAAIEPMAMGKPVIATRTGGLAEIIKDQESGLLVPLVKMENSNSFDVDIHALSQAQLRILADPALAIRLGARARIRVKTAFNVEQMIKGTLNVYESVSRPVSIA